MADSTALLHSIKEIREIHTDADYTGTGFYKELDAYLKSGWVLLGVHRRGYSGEGDDLSFTAYIVGTSEESPFYPREDASDIYHRKWSEREKPTIDDILLWLDSDAESVIGNTLPAEYIHERSEWGKFYTLHGTEFSFGTGGYSKRFPKLTFTDHHVIEKKWIFPVVAKDDQVVTYVDMFCVMHRDLEYHQDSLVPEVKDTDASGYVLWNCYIFAQPEIASIADLMRRIRQVQEVTSEGHYSSYIVASPDDRYADVLKRQGLTFIKCPPKAK